MDFRRIKIKSYSGATSDMKEKIVAGAKEMCAKPPVSKPNAPTRLHARLAVLPLTTKSEETLAMPLVARTLASLARRSFSASAMRPASSKLSLQLDQLITAEAEPLKLRPAAQEQLRSVWAAAAKESRAKDLGATPWLALTVSSHLSLSLFLSPFSHRITPNPDAVLPCCGGVLTRVFSDHVVFYLRLWKCRPLLWPLSTCRRPSVTCGNGLRPTAPAIGSKRPP
jgi:hypothetical protein